MLQEVMDLMASGVITPFSGRQHSGGSPPPSSSFLFTAAAKDVLVATCMLCVPAVGLEIFVFLQLPCCIHDPPGACPA